MTIKQAIRALENGAKREEKLGNHGLAQAMRGMANIGKQTPKH